MGQDTTALDATLTVFRVRRRIDAAIADLAAAPLDEATATQMRAVLASHELAEAHRVLASSRPTVPELQLVRGEGDC